MRLADDIKDLLNASDLSAVAVWPVDGDPNAIKLCSSSRENVGRSGE